jgi:hypothetical protein
MRVVRWIVPVLLALVIAVVARIVMGATAGGSKHSSTGSTSSPAAVAPETTTAARPHPRRRHAATSVPVRKSGRCGAITVNRYTSCAFARVVVKEYDAHPSSSFVARSPVTGLTYTMHCGQARGVIACEDNSTSRLTFNAGTSTPAPSR